MWISQLWKQLTDSALEFLTTTCGCVAFTLTSNLAHSGICLFFFPHNLPFLYAKTQSTPKKCWGYQEGVDVLTNSMFPGQHCKVMTSLPVTHFLCVQFLVGVQTKAETSALIPWNMCSFETLAGLGLYLGFFFRISFYSSSTRNLCFGRLSCSKYLLGTTDDHLLCCWNLLTCSCMWGKKLAAEWLCTLFVLYTSNSTSSSCVPSPPAVEWSTSMDISLLLGDPLTENIAAFCCHAGSTDCRL